MFLQLLHTNLDVYKYSEALTLECYKITRLFPTEEKFSMTQQIRRAALSVHLNLAEGCARKSKNERSRFFEIARSSVVEVDAAINIAYKLSYIRLEDVQKLGKIITNTFKLLTGLISQNSTKSHNSPLTTHKSNDSQ